MKKISILIIILLLNLQSTNINQITKEETNILMTLNIPKINLEKNIYQINSKENNVDINLYLLKETILPDKPNSNILIAGHNGNSKYSYFKELDKVKINDQVIINYNNTEYIYQIKEIYSIDKTGYFYYDNTLNNQIYIITCSDDNLKQIIYNGTLIDEIV